MTLGARSGTGGGPRQDALVDRGVRDAEGDF